MEEAIRLNNGANYQEIEEKPRTLDDIFDDFEYACHEADFRSDSEDECALGYDCARSELVDNGLGIAKTSKDCGRILSKLDSRRYPGLWEKVSNKQDSFLFAEILKEFDTRHESILKKNTCGESEEALEEIRCNRLRLIYITEALKLVTTQGQCSELLGRTLPRHTYLRELINEKMASLPLEVRKS